MKYNLVQKRKDNCIKLRIVSNTCQSMKLKVIPGIRILNDLQWGISFQLYLSHYEAFYFPIAGEGNRFCSYKRLVHRVIECIIISFCSRAILESQ